MERPSPFSVRPLEMCLAMTSAMRFRTLANFSVFKNFKLGEHANFEMHATALNALNHFNFSSVDPGLEHAGLGGIPGGGIGFGLPNVTSATGRTRVCWWQDHLLTLS